MSISAVARSLSGLINKTRCRSAVCFTLNRHLNSNKRLPAGIQGCSLAGSVNSRRSSWKREILLQQSVFANIPKRTFWGLDVAFNKVDEERVRLAGPDRACAEWVLRNGGTIKWTTSTKYLKNYNLLPSIDFESYKIEEIDLTATNVIGLGFEHLKDLQHVRTIKLHGCRTIQDDALGHLHFVKDSLESLDISRCPMITQKGLAQLQELKKLKQVIIYDLIEIKDLKSVVSHLQQAMPWCSFDTSDPQQDQDQPDG
ncbi:ATP synthase subunit s, mitochondrial [Aplysia californica]|uniref:ATP synthase subunit s, mitochondrial n=1 Tax=Aplysia californica TaxID=6500 RepID=A0ABM0JLU4_APLCA|nr:ATP synthase subunit s, mitochondrial [Aplysia californica]